MQHAWPEAGWDPAAWPAPLMLGVLSGDVRLAVRALRDYAQALGFAFLMPQSKVDEMCGHCGGAQALHLLDPALEQSMVPGHQSFNTTA